MRLPRPLPLSWLYPRAPSDPLCCGVASLMRAASGEPPGEGTGRRHSCPILSVLLASAVDCP